LQQGIEGCSGGPHRSPCRRSEEVEALQTVGFAAFRQRWLDATSPEGEAAGADFRRFRRRWRRPGPACKILQKGLQLCRAQFPAEAGAPRMVGLRPSGRYRLDAVAREAPSPTQRGTRPEPISAGSGADGDVQGQSRKVLQRGLPLRRAQFLPRDQ